jgi:hypothetical protein
MPLRYRRPARPPRRAGTCAQGIDIEAAIAIRSSLEAVPPARFVLARASSRCSSGCGGVGTGGIPATTSNPALSAFGSVIVGGVEFDDQGGPASLDDDGLALARNGNEVRLGQWTIEVERGRRYPRRVPSRPRRYCTSPRPLLGPAWTRSDARARGCSPCSACRCRCADRPCSSRPATRRTFRPWRVGGDVVAVYGSADARQAQATWRRAYEPAPGARTYRLPRPVVE